MRIHPKPYVAKPKHMGKKRKFGVHLLVARSGRRFAVCTSTSLRVRANNGNGLLGSPLGDDIRRDGWKSVEAVWSREGLPKATAKALANALNEGREPAGAEARRLWGEASAALPGQPKQRTALVETSDNKPIPRIMKKEKKAVATAAKIGGVKAELMTDTRYTDKNGMHAVVVRVYKDRKYAYIPTGYSMSNDALLDPSNPDMPALSAMFEAVCAYIRQTPAFSLAGLQSAVKGGTGSGVPKTLAELIVHKSASLAAEGTKAAYSSAAAKVREAFPGGLNLADVSAGTIGEVLNLIRSQGKTETTAAIYMAIIKACCNYAIYKGWLDERQYPFRRRACEADKVAVPKGAKRDSWWLSEADMDALWARFRETGSRSLGYFLFSYLCGGINLADMMDLTFDDTWRREGAFAYVRNKTRAKNTQTVKVPVTDRVSEIIAALGITPSDGARVFPEFAYGSKAEYYTLKGLATNRINKSLKHHGEACGLSMPLSMTMARHTFATLATKSRMPSDMREQAMAHVPGGVSSHYVAPYTVDEMRPYFEKLP